MINVDLFPLCLSTFDNEKQVIWTYLILLYSYLFYVIAIKRHLLQKNISITRINLLRLNAIIFENIFPLQTGFNGLRCKVRNKIIRLWLNFLTVLKMYRCL